MTDYVALALEGLGEREANRQRNQSPDYEINEKNEKRVWKEAADSEREKGAAVESMPTPAARDALALLLGLTPPPAPATVCRYCGRGGEPDAPLFTYLDGHGDHGGFCPPRRKKGSKR